MMSLKTIKESLEIETAKLKKLAEELKQVESDRTLYESELEKAKIDFEK